MIPSWLEGTKCVANITCINIQVFLLKRLRLPGERFQFLGIEYRLAVNYCHIKVFQPMYSGCLIHFRLRGLKYVAFLYCMSKRHERFSLINCAIPLLSPILHCICFINNIELSLLVSTLIMVLFYMCIRFIELSTNSILELKF